MTTKTDNDQDEVEPEEELEEKLEADSVVEEEPAKEEEAKELSPLEQLEEQVRLKDEVILKLKDTFLREIAELDNFKKRLTKEKEDFAQFANERLLKELLQIEDNLERAMEAPNATLESLKEGVEKIVKQIMDFL